MYQASWRVAHFSHKVSKMKLDVTIKNVLGELSYI